MVGMTMPGFTHRIPRMRYMLALACLLGLLASFPADARDPRKGARLATFLEYSRNLVDHYPQALGRRIGDMRRHASMELTPEELCRRAIDRLPTDLEDNPNRRIALVGAEPLGDAPDGWERTVLPAMIAENRDEHHELVQTPEGEAFRYLARLERLPPPCDEVVAVDALPAAVSIMRRVGSPPRERRNEGSAPKLLLPHPSRQGPRR